MSKFEQKQRRKGRTLLFPYTLESQYLWQSRLLSSLRILNIVRPTRTYNIRKGTIYGITGVGGTTAIERGIARMCIAWSLE
jgi:phenylacetate-coenzyme A ligase PaaK-like adenylate-forming protein